MDGEQGKSWGVGEEEDNPTLPNTEDESSGLMLPPPSFIPPEPDLQEEVTPSAEVTQSTSEEPPSSTTLTKCLICYAPTSPITPPSKGEQEVIFFVIRELLQLGQPTCDQIVETYGSGCGEAGPVRWCSQCLQLVQEAQEIWEHISNLKNKFEKLQEKVNEEICKSVIECSGGAPLNSSPSSVTDLIRRTFVSKSQKEGVGKGSHLQPSEEREEDSLLKSSSSEKGPSLHNLIIKPEAPSAAPNHPISSLVEGDPLSGGGKGPLSPYFVDLGIVKEQPLSSEDGDFDFENEFAIDGMEAEDAEEFEAEDAGGKRLREQEDEEEEEEENSDDDEWRPSADLSPYCQVVCDPKEAENSSEEEGEEEAQSSSQRYSLRARKRRKQEHSPRVLVTNLTRPRESSEESESRDSSGSRVKVKAPPRTTPKKKKLKCPLCSASYISIHQMNAHYATKHLKSELGGKSKKRKRPPPKRQINSESEEYSQMDLSHLESSGGGRKGERKYHFKCPECPQHFPSEYFRDAHHRRRHLGIKLSFICDKCGKAYERNAGLETHKKSCTGDGTFIYPDPKEQEVEKFKCPKCPRHYPSEVARDAHLKRWHDGIAKPFDCLCGKCYKTQRLLNEHEVNCRFLREGGAEGGEQSQMSIDSFMSLEGTPTLEGQGNKETPLKKQVKGRSSDYGGGGESCGSGSGPAGDRKRLFKCSECPQSFPSEHFRDAHHRRRHLGIRLCFICNKCGKAFERNQGLEAHRKGCTGDGRFIYPSPRLQEVPKFKCPKCPRTFPSETSKDAHLKRLHEGIERPFQCSTCPNSYKLQKMLTNHERRCYLRKLGDDGNRTLGEGEEANCEIKVERPEVGEDEDLGESDISSGPNLQYKCPYENCNKVFLIEEVRDGHVRKVHEGMLRPFECDICGKGFNRLRGLKDHQKVHENSGNPYKCDICKKEFASKASLKSHNHLTHEKVLPLKCNFCDAQFKRNSALTRHVEGVHEKLRNFVCDLCGQSFPRSTHLTFHQHSKHYIELSLDPYKCSECDKMFAQPYQLEQHKKVQHDKNFAFLCTICSQGFVKKSALDQHMLAHTGEKPCKCEVCGQGFTRNSDLRSHMRLHTGERPYKCPLCDLSFSDSSKLGKHKRKHEPPKYECDLCPKKFLTSTSLKSHMQHMHDPNNPPKPRGAALNQEKAKQRRFRVSKFPSEEGASYNCEFSNVSNAQVESRESGDDELSFSVNNKEKQGKGPIRSKVSHGGDNVPYPSTWSEGQRGETVTNRPSEEEEYESRVFAPSLPLGYTSGSVGAPGSSSLPEGGQSRAHHHNPGQFLLNSLAAHSSGQGRDLTATARLLSSIYDPIAHWQTNHHHNSK